MPCSYSNVGVSLVLSSPALGSDARASRAQFRSQSLTPRRRRVRVRSPRSRCRFCSLMSPLRTGVLASRVPHPGCSQATPLVRMRHAVSPRQPDRGSVLRVIHEHLVSPLPTTHSCHYVRSAVMRAHKAELMVIIATFVALHGRKDSQRSRSVRVCAFTSRFAHRALAHHQSTSLCALRSDARAQDGTGNRRRRHGRRVLAVVGIVVFVSGYGWCGWVREVTGGEASENCP